MLTWNILLSTVAVKHSTTKVVIKLSSAAGLWTRCVLAFFFVRTDPVLFPSPDFSWQQAQKKCSSGRRGRGGNGGRRSTRTPSPPLFKKATSKRWRPNPNLLWAAWKRRRRRGKEIRLIKGGERLSENKNAIHLVSNLWAIFCCFLNLSVSHLFHDLLAAFPPLIYFSPPLSLTTFPPFPLLQSRFPSSSSSTSEFQAPTPLVLTQKGRKHSSFGPTRGSTAKFNIIIFFIKKPTNQRKGGHKHFSNRRTGFTTVPLVHRRRTPKFYSKFIKSAIQSQSCFAPPPKKKDLWVVTILRRRVGDFIFFSRLLSFPPLPPPAPSWCRIGVRKPRNGFFFSALFSNPRDILVGRGQFCSLLSKDDRRQTRVSHNENIFTCTKEESKLQTNLLPHRAKKTLPLDNWQQK